MVASTLCDTQKWEIHHIPYMFRKSRSYEFWFLETCALSTIIFIWTFVNYTYFRDVNWYWLPAILQLKQLVSGFPLRQPGSDPRSGHVGSMLEKSGSGPGFLQVLWFSLTIFNPPTTVYSLILFTTDAIWSWYCL
jgi:hypothetical protein